MDSLDLQQPAESRAFAKPVNLWERLLARLGNGSFRGEYERLALPALPLVRCPAALGAAPRGAPAVSTPVLGRSHVSLSVPDLGDAVEFWVDVLGFEPLNDDPAFRFLLHRDARLAVVLTDHAGAVQGRFDEHNAGLDHLALAVGDLDTLQNWAAALTARGVATSGVVASDAGHHLNFRTPGDVPLETAAGYDHVLSQELAAVADLDRSRRGLGPNNRGQSARTARV